MIVMFGLLLSVNAQSNFWEGGLMLGTSAMGGDLVAPELGSFNDANLAFGLMARRYVNPKFAFRFNLIFSRLTGNDDRYDYLAYRGYTTQTPLTELSADFEWDILGYHRNGSTLR